MNRCKTCKWWKPMPKDQEWGNCWELPSSPFTSISYEDHTADAETHQDFGCALWEAKG